MTAVVLSPADAAALCARISAALGYPVQCTTVDGTPIDLWTTAYVEPMPHPSDPTRAAVPVDDVIREIADPVIAVACAEARELGAEWDPPRLPF